MVATTASFRAWLKGGLHMKLSSDAAVTRITHEGITDFDSLVDFDDAAIKNLPRICKENIPAIAEDQANNIAAEAAVNGANISSISVQRLMVAANAARYYKSIGRALTSANMHYGNILSNFKVEWEAYELVRDEDDPKVPLINDRDGDRKIIRWAPIFLDHLEVSHGAKGPLRYVVRENAAVETELVDPLAANAYYGKSGSLVEELIARLPHTGPVYKSDNAAVYMKVEEAARGTSVESTIKPFARRKDGRGALEALLANHGGEVKYRAIAKKRQNLLQNIKWTGNSYPLETHVSNHRQAYDDIRECSAHITVPVPSDAQRVEYLIDSITSKDSSLMAALGIVRANTNNMRTDFEAAASSLIEVDPYRRTTRPGRNAQISAIDFAAGRGKSGVDLRFHPREEFLQLPDDQKDELRAFLETNEGKKSKKAYYAKLNKKDKEEKENKKRKGGDNPANGTWKKKMKRALKTEQGLKAVMAILAEEETNNQALVAAFTGSAATPLPPAPAATPVPAPTQNETGGKIAALMPATTLKLRSIMKK